MEKWGGRCALLGSSQCTTGDRRRSSTRAVSKTPGRRRVRVVRSLFRGQYGCRRGTGGIQGGTKASLTTAVRAPQPSVAGGKMATVLTVAILAAVTMDGGGSEVVEVVGVGA